MKESKNFDKEIQKLKKEINNGKRIIVALLICMVAFRLIYTTVGIQHEKATGKKQFQIIPYDAALYSLYLLSKHDTDTLGKQNAPAPHP